MKLLIVEDNPDLLDNILTKPFQLPELLASIKAVHRRNDLGGSV